MFLVGSRFVESARRLSVGRSLGVLFLALGTFAQGCASSRVSRQTPISNSNPRRLPSRAPAKSLATATPTKKNPALTKKPQAFLCESSRALGPRYRLEFHGDQLNPKQKRIPPLYSLRLPRGASPAEAWLKGTEDPNCIGVDSNGCSSVDKEILAAKHPLKICGEQPRTTPLVGVFLKRFVVFGAPESRKEAEARLLRKCGVSNDASMQTIRISEDLITFNRLDERAMDRSCTVDFTDVESYDHDDHNSMHYHGFALYDSTPKSFNIAVVVYVVHEKDWPIVADTIRASARSFEVDWDSFYAREALENT